MPNMTHWGLSISIGRASSSSSSGKTGASLSTVVSRLTVETVTNSRNAVSTNEHLLTGLQCKMDVPNGIKMAARAQSTIAWWNRRPWLHLRAKCILLSIKMAVQNRREQTDTLLIKSHSTRSHIVKKKTLNMKYRKYFQNFWIKAYSLQFNSR